jgi:hypothetical protein
MAIGAIQLVAHITLRVLLGMHNDLIPQSNLFAGQTDRNRLRRRRGEYGIKSDLVLSIGGRWVSLCGPDWVRQKAC